MTRIAESLNLTLSAHGLLSDHFHKENSFLLCFCFKWVHTLPTKHHAHLETIWSDTCCSILEVINQTGLCNDNTCNDPGLKPGEGSSCDFLGVFQALFLPAIKKEVPYLTEWYNTLKHYITQGDCRFQELEVSETQWGEELSELSARLDSSPPSTPADRLPAVSNGKPPELVLYGLGYKLHNNKGL